MSTLNESNFGAKRKLYLDATNSLMVPQNNNIAVAQGGVPSNGEIAQPYMPTSLNDALFGTRRSPARVATTVDPMATRIEATPQAPGVAHENVATQDAAFNAGLGARRPDEIAPGTGFIVDNTTGKVIPVGNGGSNGNTGYGARMAITKTPDPYATAAGQAVDQSQNLMNQDVSMPTVTSTGQVLSPGAQAVGNGIVARGMLNRAKVLSDISNTTNSTQAGVQNSDVNAANVQSLIGDRTADNARLDQVAQLGARKGNLEIGNLEQLNQLQNQYLTETDPAKREQIASTISVLNGKAADKYQPIMGKDELGNPVYLGAFNARTGEATNQPGKTVAPPVALDFLAKNPNQAAAFKQKYGYLPAGF